MALSHILQKGSSHANSLNIGYLPVFFRIRSHTDRQALQKLMESNPAIVVFDAIEGQLTELMKAANPTQRLSAGDLADAVKKHLGGVPPEEYGVWVYYPWSGRLVHILDEKEFIELRTSRNLYKITREEREILSKQKIGVIGLSVGQSIAVTMAMERTFGEIRLADFDTLELTNMNRIRTGLHNLGVSKVMLAAREIAEIDPFLKVVCFTEGITEDNIDDFLLKDGRLNILVDECDSLDVKIYARVRAKAHRIPVVMDTSDRGMVDIERFDLEPERPLLHGLIGHLNIVNAKNLTDFEKIPYLKSFVGYEKISNGLRTSEKEIGKTIRTWPQLASSVILGGAIGTDVCRRIALGQLQASGRYYVDLENIINNSVPSDI
jgi:molybdopterin/thiamine biosynthesis adenylyltransferase